MKIRYVLGLLVCATYFLVGSQVFATPINFADQELTEPQLFGNSMRLTNPWTITLPKNGHLFSRLFNGDRDFSDTWPAMNEDSGNSTIVTLSFDTAKDFLSDNIPSNEQFPVPEPATMLLLGSGLVGLAGFRRKFRKK